MGNKILFMIYLFVFCLGSFDLVSAQEHDITFQARISPTEVPQNKTATLKITLEWKGPASLFEVEEITQPRLINLTVSGSGSTNRVVTEGGIPETIKEYSFELQPQALGMAYIEAMNIRYVCYADSQVSTLQTQRIELKVSEPVYQREGRAMVWVIIIGPMFLIALLSGFFLWRRKQQREALAQQQVMAVQTPRERILTELRQRIDLSDPGHIDEKCEALSKAVRSYLKECRSIEAAYLPTRELEQELDRQQIDEEERQTLILVLASCDEVKFAKKNLPISEFENLYTKFEYYFEVASDRQEQPQN